MQIVIEIDEHIYEQVMADSEVYVLDNEVDRILIENALYNGTPLPEHHGRLIDANELCKQPVSSKAVLDAPTIIEGSESE